ncbi:DUF1793-domain-containing protein [Trametes coccinea BRFM310]|uniref:DUF1793-domain-containing protein n=1 Tax=Trametes coccinea (strain BRFM310) TaxID=1353009 RepID=A0A1Y2ISW0_TRAC3|nr:DUF1793-domain-containing protein [Trametes coccinea BRFM310]
MLTLAAAIVYFAVGYVGVEAATPWTAKPFNPASVPLAVRSPYLSAWLNQGQGTALNDAWPSFWTGSTLGWAGFAKVDGMAYNWMGVPAIPGVTFEKATQKSLEVTSTQSIFVMTAGPVDLTITFLSPVEPASPTNQSFPFSYLAVSAASNDGKDHIVQVYADISAEWISGDDTLEAQWNTTVGDAVIHEVQLAAPQPFVDIGSRAQYGSAFHATLKTADVTFQTGQDIVLRTQFINNGALPNAEDSNFRAVQQNWPVFALAHDLGPVNAASSPVVFAVGHVRDPAIQYIVQGNQLQQRSLAFWSQTASIDAAITAFLNDYSDALERAKTLDARVDSDASKISADYASLMPLSVRQAFGAMEVTVSKTGIDGFNGSDVLIFMKGISSDGNVNTADVIFSAWPLFLYINPMVGKQLLLPLFEYQATGQYPNAWAAHDIGATYPNATGHNDGNDLQMPVEESGNMLIMTLSYTQRTNDTSLIRNYYNLLDQWARYLVQNSLTPALQLSSDVLAGALANQTNLAIKGIIGIKAMSEIAAIAGDTERSTNYSTIASVYVQDWEKLAMSSDGTHLTLAYGNSSSWGIAYNLYADKLLGTDLFPKSIYDLQTKWYGSHANPFGLPLDTRVTYAKSDWQMLTAATVTDDSIRNVFISSVLKYAADGKNAKPFSDMYSSLDGTAQDPRARPLVGGHLALLALQSNASIFPSSPSDSTGSSGATPTGSPSEGSGQPVAVTVTSTASIPSTPGGTNSAPSGWKGTLGFNVGAVCISIVLGVFVY